MDHRIELILNEINSDNSVLDIGCVHHNSDTANTNFWLHKYLYKQAKNVLGMDILEEECEKLRSIGFNVVSGDAESFSLNQKFDVIIAGELIEHLSNPGNFLDRCFEHLNENGILIITTPNAWCILNFISALLKKSVSVHEQHTAWYDKKTLFQILLRHNFKEVNFEYIKPRTGARGHLFSNLIYNLKIKILGGVGLFFVVTKVNNPR